MAASGGSAWTRILRQAVQAGVEAAVRTASSTSRRRATSPPRERSRGTPAAGDSLGVPVLEYAPVDDEEADPGEVVWTRVAFEDDPSRGKDRPVLVIGRDGGRLLALMLSSQDHDLDAADEARYGRVWMDIGAGAWDSRRRPSEVRLDRVLRIDPGDVRRQGARLPRPIFDDVAAALRSHHGWPRTIP